MRLFPHPRFPMDAAEWGGWSLVTPGHSRLPLGEAVPDWDYDSEITLERSVRVPLHHLESIGASPDDVALVVTVDCLATQTRLVDRVRLAQAGGSHRQPLHEAESEYEGWRKFEAEGVTYFIGRWSEDEQWVVADETDATLATAADFDSAIVLMEELFRLQDNVEATAAVRIPAHSVAEQLNLRAHLVHSGDNERSVWRTGARLAETPEHRVRLEGEGSRFPTEAVSFESLGYERALWTLRVSFETLDENFMGAVLLLVNTDHPSGAALLQPDQSLGEVLTAFLRRDILIRLVTAIAAQPDALEAWNPPPADPEDGPDQSLGSVVDSTCRLLTTFDLKELVSVLNENPERFDRIVQAAAVGDLAQR